MKTKTSFGYMNDSDEPIQLIQGTPEEIEEANKMMKADRENFPCGPEDEPSPLLGKLFLFVMTVAILFIA